MSSGTLTKHRGAEPWNEAFAAPGLPRPLYAPVLEALRRADLTGLTAAVEERIEDLGANFGGAPLAVCPVPRLIDRAGWSGLAAGIEQRVRALCAFVADAYGTHEIVDAGIMPSSVIEHADGYEPELRGRWPRTHSPLGVVGLDIVRCSDGQLRVLEDNTRTPSGFAYAAAVRDAVIAALTELVPALADSMPAPLPLETPVVAALRATLLDAASCLSRSQLDQREQPFIVVLTDGSDSSASFEHVAAAEWLGIPSVRIEDLERRENELWLRAGDAAPARRIDVVYRRNGTDSLRDERGQRTPVAELLLEPWLAGEVGLVNAFGTGVADDKLAHAYVEQMIEFYLCEEPLLRSVTTLDLNEPETLDSVLSDLHGHVIKPRHGQGGRGVVVCAHASSTDVALVEAALRDPDAGARFIAQPTVPLSLHPTVVDSRLALRHIDLRPFAFVTGAAVQVVHGGLTRFAKKDGALVVNSSQAGGAKDTWVLT